MTSRIIRAPGRGSGRNLPAGTLAGFPAGLAKRGQPQAIGISGLRQLGIKTAQQSQASLTGMLDQAFGTTEGTVIYRDATQWLGLAPGTPGEFLQTQGPGVAPLWATPSGSGGGQREYEAFNTLPLSTSMTKFNFQSGTTVTDSAASMMLDLPPQAAFNLQGLYVAAPATPYDLYARFAYRDTITGSARGGIGLFNSSTNLSLAFMRGSTQQAAIWSDTTLSGSGSANLYNENYLSGINWVRIHNDGTNIQFYISADGLNWSKFGGQLACATYPVNSLSIASFCEAAANRQVTVWVSAFGTSAPT